jgi:hypothetical protein
VWPRRPGQSKVHPRTLARPGSDSPACLPSKTRCARRSRPPFGNATRLDNIKKAIAYVFAVHVPIAGLSIIPLFHADWPLLLLPVHIVFLELIIDPACSLVFEAEETEPDAMRRPPRNPLERLFSVWAVTASLFQGLGPS